MTVTIAMPTYNRCRYLDEAFTSALCQSYRDYEVLIGDSSHHDGVYKKVAPLAAQDKVRYERFPPTMTQMQKFNELIKLARGDWMVFLCDDDLLEPGYLQTLMDHAAAHPQAVLIRPRFKLIDEKGRTLRFDPMHKPVMQSAEFLSHLFLPERKFFKMNITGILFKRKILQNERGFRELPTTWHTDLLAWTLVGSRGQCIFEKRSLCSIRLHPYSLTSSFDEDTNALIQTSLAVRDEIMRVLKRMENQATTVEELGYIKAARDNLNALMRRHLSRSFDRGFLSVLSEDRRNVVKDMSFLYGWMKQLGVPHFSSSRLYPYLGWFPYSLRRPMLDMVKWYKTKKWCS